MFKSRAEKIFEKYNPAKDVLRCPDGRAKMRKPLDTYAQAAVKLYGIIARDDFVAIFNAQNEEQTTADEVYTILLPNVLESRMYGFYKDYIVHHAILQDFGWVDHLEQVQAHKPRYVPPKERFLEFEWEEHEDNEHWDNVLDFMQDAFPQAKDTETAFMELRDYLLNSLGISKIGKILDEFDLVFADENQMQDFISLLVSAKNNTRCWENNGHTPSEMIKLRPAKRRAGEPIVQISKKTEPNEPCPCGSGRKYKKCCKRIESGGMANLPNDGCKLFYETWYKLLDFVNKKFDVTDYRFSMIYEDFHDGNLCHKIREKLWENPKVIGEFLDSTNALSDKEASLLRSWEERHLKGDFILLRYMPKHSVFMHLDKGEGNVPRLYAVKGIKSPINEILKSKIPVMLNTVLLPFGDMIIYDSFVKPYGIGFGDGMIETLEDEYAELEEKYGIAETL